MSKKENYPSISRGYQNTDLSKVGFKIDDNIQFVVDNGLCHGCGTCFAVCDHDAIEMSFHAPHGVYYPVINSNNCVHCNVCVLACSGFAIDLENDWQKEDFGLMHDNYVGNYHHIYRAYTNNEERRKRAASGGIITEIVSFLLETSTVNGAILTRMDKNNPLKAEAYIANNIEQIIPSQKSKYCPSPLNVILKDIIRNNLSGPFVYVGLPSQIHGLRLAQRLFPQLNEAIPYVLSIFTAHVPSQKATEFILFKQGLKPDQVELIEYRGGGNPGRMRIIDKNRKEYFIPHLHWTYSGHNFPYFFYPAREWLYFDKISEWADISCGDNWMLGIKEQKGGKYSDPLLQKSSIQSLKTVFSIHQDVSCAPCN